VHDHNCEQHVIGLVSHRDFDILLSVLVTFERVHVVGYALQILYLVYFKLTFVHRTSRVGEFDEFDIFSEVGNHDFTLENIVN